VRRADLPVMPSVTGRDPREAAAGLVCFADLAVL
jgi:hypothetical protein